MIYFSKTIILIVNLLYKFFFLIFLIKIASKRLKKDLKLFFENINEIICLNLAENLKILLENLIISIENLIFQISNYDNLIKIDPNGISKTLNKIIILINILMELILITPPTDKLLINTSSQEEIISYKGAILSHCFQLLQYDNYKVLNVKLNQ